MRMLHQHEQMLARKLPNRPDHQCDRHHAIRNARKLSGSIGGPLPRFITAPPPAATIAFPTPLQLASGAKVPPAGAVHFCILSPPLQKSLNRCGVNSAYRSVCRTRGRVRGRTRPDRRFAKVEAGHVPQHVRIYRNSLPTACPRGDNTVVHLRFDTSRSGTWYAADLS
jgi:hypothetical protein